MNPLHDFYNSGLTIQWPTHTKHIILTLSCAAGISSVIVCLQLLCVIITFIQDDCLQKRPDCPSCLVHHVIMAPTRATSVLSKQTWEEEQKIAYHLLIELLAWVTLVDGFLVLTFVDTSSHFQ